MRTKSQPPYLPTPIPATRLALISWFRAVVRAYSASARRVAGIHGVSNSQLDDVTQSVFETYWSSLRRGMATALAVPPWAWLHVVTRRKAQQHVAEEARRREQLANAIGEHDAGEAPSSEEPYSSRQTIALVHQILATLDPARREVLRRYELEGEPIPEIAADLGIPIGTVHSRLRLARLDFKAECLMRRRRDEGKPGGHSFGLMFFALSWNAEELAPPPGNEPPAIKPPEPSGAAPSLAVRDRRQASPRSGESNGKGKESWGMRAACIGLLLMGLWLVDSRLASPSWPDLAGDVQQSAAAERNERVASAEKPILVPELPPAVVPAAGPLVALPHVAVSVPSLVEVAAPPLVAVSALPGPLVAPPSRRSHNLQTARILLDTADRMAIEGRQNAVDGALRAYAVHGPDDPLPASRAAVTSPVTATATAATTEKGPRPAPDEVR